MNYLRQLALAGAVLWASSAQASFINVDMVVGSGDGLLTRDTVTGFEWLNLSLTKGTDFATLQSWLAAGGKYAGYNLATSAAVSQLFVHAGWDGSGYLAQTGEDSYDWVPTDIDGAFELYNHIGGNYWSCQEPSCHSSWSLNVGGRVSDVTGPNSHGTYSGYAGLNYIYLSSYRSTGTIDDSARNEWTGAFLYRDTNVAEVPEPGTALLLIPGLAYLAMMRRRKKTPSNY